MIIKIKKFVSVAVILSMIFNFIQPITYANSEVSNITTEEVETASFSSNHPQINAQYLGATPKNPMVGQEFTLKYSINPQPFRMSFAKDLEIIFVLDNSEGMGKHEYLKSVKASTASFVNSFTEVVDEATKFQNLNIGLVSFNSSGTIEHTITSVIKDSQVQEENLSQLLQTINNVESSGKKNIGDGLRKTAYLLSQTETNMERAVILLTEGALNAATVESKKNSSLYMNIDNLNPGEKNDSKPYLYTGCNGNDTKCQDYGIKMAKILSSKINHVFSIMIGGSSENSNHHAHLSLIHTAMGGKGKPFYAGTNEIQGVFDQIAQELEKLYSISPVLNLSLDSSFVLKDGTNLKINPVEYTLGDDGWYTASSQIIEITMTATKEGEYSIFEKASLSYKDIAGNDKTISINSPTISIRPYDANQKDLLAVDFTFVPENALIGDPVEAVATMIRPDNNINYSNVKFNISNSWNLPSVFSSIGSIKPQDSLDFGTLTSSQSKSYQFLIRDVEEIKDSQAYTLDGAYSYNLSTSPYYISQNSSPAFINVKRGQVKVKVLDELGQNITEHTSIDISLSNKVAQFMDGTYIFDTVPTGNYFLTLSALPEGCSIEPGQEKVNVSVNFDNNVVEYQFKVEGTYEEELHPNIEANLLSVDPSVASNGQEIDVTYQIKGEPFDSLPISGGGIDEAVIIFDLSVDISLYTKYDAIRRSIVNCLITDEQLIKNNFGLSIIGYNETAVFPTLNAINYKRTFDLGIPEENKIIRDLIEQPYIYNQGAIDKNKTRIIDDALEEADKILSLNQDKKKKSIIILSNENIKYSDMVVSKIKDKGYEIISLNLGQGYQSADNSTTLIELHEKLGGKENYFEVPTPDTIGWGSYSNFDNELNLIRDLLVGKQQSEKSSSSSLSIKADLSFDLGNHFLPVSGLTWIKDTSYKLDLPTINYKSTTQNSDGTYKYEAEEFEVSFKIKLNTEQLGEVTFANTEDKIYNNITYTQFDGKDVMKLIETPKVEVIEMPIEISHGLYGGINADKTSVDIIPSVITTDGQDLRKTFVASSTINFAGLISYHPNLREVTLYTDQRLNINPDKIEVYKVITSQNGRIKLEKLLDVKMTSSEIDGYKKVLFNLPEGLADTSSLLIRYSTLAPDIDEGTFKNAIVAGTESEVVEVKTISEKNPDQSNLPNLF